MRKLTMEKRFLLAIALSVIVNVLFIYFGHNSKYTIGATVGIFILYTFAEMVHTFVKNSNKHLISGFALLIVTIVTFGMGFWDKDLINKGFIMSIAIAALYYTFKEFIEIGDMSDDKKKYIKSFLFMSSALLVCILLMLDSSILNIDRFNTDYLAFISLGVALATTGLRQQKQQQNNEEKEKNT